MTDPHAELKAEAVARVRRLHEQATEKARTNQDRRNAEAGSPDEKVHDPRGKDL
jgi:hypothetical protein